MSGVSQSLRISGTVAGLAAASLVNAPPATAVQDTVAVGVQAAGSGEEIPRQAANRIVDFYNRSTTIRFSGRIRLPAERSIDGDVAILGGPVELEGRIAGEVVVINGDLTLRDGSRIDGDLTVVGGVVEGADDAVAGTITTYTSILRYRRVGDEIEYMGTSESSPPPGRTRLALPSFALGESEIYVSGRAYNRVEGLPIAIGPRITTGGRNPFRIEAWIIWRSEYGFSGDETDLGYEVRLKQWFGGHRDFWLEAALWSVNNAIENWQITNLENSLSLFLFKRDYRDYYEREGWYTRLGWRSGPTLFGSLEYRDERHSTQSASDVWTILFNTNDPVRPNAAINDGRLRSAVFTIGIDTRSDERRPLSGWYNQFSIEQALSGELSGFEPTFTSMFLDLRRYNRVSLGSVLAFRFLLGGRVGGGALPAQRQHFLGGTGSLPGYGQQEFDCGARQNPTFGELPGYGCNRIGLFQAEYRTGLNFKFHWDHKEYEAPASSDIFSIDLQPTIVLFYDAGSAWSTDESFFDHLTDTGNWVADIGGGFELGSVGLYLAYPLSGPGGVEGVVRLTSRF